MSSLGAQGEYGLVGEWSTTRGPYVNVNEDVHRLDEWMNEGIHGQLPALPCDLCSDPPYSGAA